MWLILAAMLAEEPPQKVAMPAWMAGCWEHKGADSWTEECWTAPRGGIMLGSGRSGTGGVLDSWEVMQIEMIETDDPDSMTFDTMSEEELLRGIESLAPPERRDD